MFPDIEGADTFEETNNFLNILKKLVASFQSIVQLKYQQSSGLITKVFVQSQQLLDIQQNIKNKTQVSNSMNNYERSCDKLRLRIKQWLGPVKLRYSNGSQYKNIRCFLQQLQVALGIFDKNSQLLSLVSKTFSITCQQLRQLKIKMELIPKTGQDQQNKQSKFQDAYKMTQNSKVSLSSLYSMDLDYHLIRSLLMSGRRSQKQIMYNQLQRNKFILKQVQKYSQEHYIFCSRVKNKQKYQKDQKNKTKTSYFNKAITTRNIRVKTVANEKQPYNFRKPQQKSIRNQNQNFLELQPIVPHKPVFKVNNVYVSGNEFDLYGQQPSICFKKQLPSGKRKATIFLTRALRDPLSLKISNQQISELCHL